MGVSVSTLRAAAGRLVDPRALPPAARALRSALARARHAVARPVGAAAARSGPGRLLRAWAGGALAAGRGLRPPAALLALAPLALGPPAAPAALRDLLLGLLLLLVLERAAAPLAAALPGPWRAVPPAPAAAALAALAAAASAGAGLLLPVLVAAGADLAGRRLGGALPRALCLALGATVRVEAGALLLGGGRGPLLPLAVGAAVLLATLAAAGPARPAASRAARAAGDGRLDLWRLAGLALALGLAMALATEVGGLGAAPSPWAVLGTPLLLLAGLSVLAAGALPAAGGAADPQRAARLRTIAAAAALAWLATLAGAAWPVGPG